jgi:beta-lactamase regulating signal transducer with metallopeptidase domain
MDVFIADAAAALHLTEQGIWLLVKAALILGVAWGLTTLFRRRSAAVRHVVWSAAMGLLIALPLLIGGLPVWHMDIPFLPDRPLAPAWVGETSTPASSSLQDGGSYEFESLESEYNGLSTVSDGQPVSRTVADSGFTLPRVSIFFFAILVWMGGVLLLLGRLIRQLFRIRGVSARSTTPAVSKPVRLTEELACEMGIQRPVKVLCSNELPVPVTWGLRAPVIILPCEASVWPEERLRVVLLHELAHIKRWDYLTHLVSEVACAWYWPNPLVWFARERVYVEQEQACDDRVLTSGTRPYEYAEHLLEIARGFQTRRRAVTGTIAMARGISLKFRIRTILDRGLDRHPLSPRSGFLVSIVLVAFALPLAALRPADPASETDEESMPAVVEHVSLDTEALPKTAPVERSGIAYVWLESEDAQLQGAMSVQEDLQASAGYFMYIPERRSSRQEEQGAGVFNVNVSHAGDYTIWARVQADGRGNTLHVSVDSGEEMPWEIRGDRGGRDQWTWIQLASGVEPAVFPLEAGGHLIRIRSGEEGAGIDRMLLTNDPSFVPQGRGPLPANAQPAYLWMEAEDALREGTVQVRTDEYASGQECANLFSRNGAEGTGVLRFTFDVSAPGPYVIWGRAMGEDRDRNSFFVSVDGSEAAAWEIRAEDEHWTWDLVSTRDEDGRGSSPMILDLQPGRHVIELQSREDGADLDGLFITSNLSYRPRGVKPIVPPADPVHVVVGAEQAVVDGKMELRADAASGGRYITPAEGVESRRTPPSDGSATLRFSVPQAGTYTLWAQVSIPDDESDSFWVRMNDGRWVRWNEIRRGEDWHWDELHDADYGRELVQFDLEAGEQTLEIAYREEGAKLDQLVVTNDPFFRPADNMAVFSSSL